MSDRPAAVESGEARGAGAPERPLAFHQLTFLSEGDDVTVGRPDEGEFVVLPADGAALLRRLVEGQTCTQAAQWYLETYGEPVDVADFVADLGELGFLRGADDPDTRQPAPVRWSRLGRAVFSPVGAPLAPRPAAS
ncbi:hypothetical protein ACIGXM_12650 [Kitasatospora sp. NPDC052896]|uniref:hypothetical protein n=1 Tax=Kitasatospora sp. NPDC052896 TaxID=3364061 RepID=UPI0037C50B07